MTRRAALLLARLNDIRFLRYVFASSGALTVDLGAFLGALALGVAAAPASALSYSLGILAHWLLSTRLVFLRGVAPSGPARTRQKALFVISALAGLALTVAIVGLVDVFGGNPRLGKLAAIIASFTLTYALRATVVFGRGVE